MKPAEERLRNAQRIIMIEGMLQEYTLDEGKPVFIHTTDAILQAIVQHYPEEMAKRIAMDKTPPQAREMILIEIQKRARKMQKSGITAGFKPRDIASGPRNMTPSEVTEWFKIVQNVQMLSKDQLREIALAVDFGKNHYGIA